MRSLSASRITGRSNLPKVTYGSNDAEMMRDYLVGVCGFKPENIKLLVNEGATKSDLEAYFEEWLLRNVRKGAFVFVYFAGHGTPNPEEGDAYIVPYDGEQGFISKLYPLSKLYTALAALPTSQIVVALDACFSGLGSRSVLPKGARAGFVPVKLKGGDRRSEQCRGADRLSGRRDQPGF